MKLAATAGNENKLIPTKARHGAGRYGIQRVLNVRAKIGNAGGLVILIASVVTLSGCGSSHKSSLTTTPTSTASHPVSAAERGACQQFEQAASTIPENNYGDVTLTDFTQYSHAVQGLVQTAYGPGSGQVMTAMRDVDSLPVVNALSDQQLARIDHDAASLGTFCGRVLAGG
jgi:hypothetical protein